MSDLNTRRARIQNMEEHEGMQDIEALVPEAEIVDYVTQLKSITQASGYFNREFVNYEEVPEYLKDKVIKENIHPGDALPFAVHRHGGVRVLARARDRAVARRPAVARGRDGDRHAVRIHVLRHQHDGAVLLDLVRGVRTDRGSGEHRTILAPREHRVGRGGHAGGRCKIR